MHQLTVFTDKVVRMKKMLLAVQHSNSSLKRSLS